jgi:D-galactonate transporter
MTERLDRVYGKVSLRVLPLLMLAYVIAYLDRVNISFAKLQMIRDLGFSETMYGLGAGIFFVGYFLFEVPSNLILHRVGARRWIARIMLSWGVVSAGMMFVTSSATYYVLRFLLGAAEAGFFPGVIFYLTLWYPSARRGKVIAIFMTGIAISGAMGSVLSGWIMQTFDGVHGWAGWQWLFLLEAMPAAVVGLLLLFLLPDRPNSTTWLDDHERSLLERDLARDAGGTREGSLMDAVRDPRVWLSCLIYFCATAGLYGIAFWSPTIIAETGISDLRRVGFLAALPYAAAAIGMVLVGHSADQTGERRWHVAIPASVGALGLVLSVIFRENVNIAMAALTLATLGTFTAVPLFWGLPTRYLRGGAAAAGIAIINSFGNLAGFLAPYVVGWIKDLTGSTGMGVYLLAAVVFASGLLVIFGVRRTTVRYPACDPQVNPGSQD